MPGTLHGSVIFVGSMSYYKFAHPAPCAEDSQVIKVQCYSEFWQEIQGTLQKTIEGSLLKGLCREAWARIRATCKSW